MSKLEALEEFFARIDDGVESGTIGAAEMRSEFAARDNAVRLALLDEIWADAERLKAEHNIIPFRGAVLLARSKYMRLSIYNAGEPKPIPSEESKL